MPFSLTYRRDLSAPLNAAQFDGNTDYFKDKTDTLAADIAALGTGISSITQSGNLLTFHMNDGSTQGPFTLPALSFLDIYTGAWQPSFAYTVGKLFVAGIGLYAVAYAHTSGTTFDPAANDGAGHNYYELVLRMPNIPSKTVSDASYTLSPADSNFYIRFTNAGGCTITVPAGLPQDADIHLRQVTTGVLTLVAQTGVTINGVAGHTLSTGKQGATVWVKCINAATNEFDVAGLFAS